MECTAFILQKAWEALNEFAEELAPGRQRGQQ